MLKVVKKNNKIDDWDEDKIINAVLKACARTNTKLSDIELSEVVAYVLDSFVDRDVVTVQEVHSSVEQALDNINNNVAKAYKDYRNYKTDFVKLWDDIYNKTKDVLYQGDKENSNFESTLVSTKGSLVKGYLAKELYKKFYLTDEELKAINTGFIYVHDLRDLIFGGINCCLYDMGNVLKGGFEMSNLKYSEPSGILSALQVMGDVILSASSQQFGGFTVPEVDKVALPYIKKSIKYYTEEATKWGIIDVNDYVLSKVKRELYQGIQSLEMKLNSIPSSRGDFSFTTLSFGALCCDKDDRYLQKLFCETLLDVRKKGHGKGEVVVFPKLVFLFLQKQYDNHEDYRDLFYKAIKCSQKAQYPDYLSVDGEGAVGDIYRNTGEIVSPMGCRAYLSDFKGKNGKSVFVGRANVGAIALHLPMIWKESEGKNFYQDLDKYLEMIRNFLKRRYESLAKVKCSSNPMGFCQGGLYGGNKQPTDEIGMDIVKSFTSSFGITALNELNVLAEGKPLHQSDRKFLNEVMDYINNKVNQFKKEDGYLYAIYYVPAESLAGTQREQFKERFGIIEGVSDRPYLSNGFHAHVSADLTPFEKQDVEHELFHKGSGGRIQYCRYSNGDNFEAIKNTVLRAMKMGFYEGVNLEIVICQDCGYRPSTEVEFCPECGSHEILSLARTCGYISYKKIHGDTRFNQAKLAEINDRVSM